MTIESLRSTTSNYFLERVRRKDGLADPAVVDPSIIDATIDQRLVSYYYSTKAWKTALPVIVDKSVVDIEKTEFHLGVYLTEQPRLLTPDSFINYPHLLVDITQVSDNEMRLDRKVFEILFYPIDPNNDPRIWFSIFRREINNQNIIIKSAIELGYERDGKVSGMALIVRPNKDQGVNTRFVYVQDDKVQYSSKQEFEDDSHD